MTCASCHHSTSYWRGGLWCCLWARRATALCERFEYEPGTDGA